MAILMGSKGVYIKLISPKGSPAKQYVAWCKCGEFDTPKMGRPFLVQEVLDHIKHCRGGVVHDEGLAAGEVPVVGGRDQS